VNKLRVSVVQYLNTAPLVWGFTQGLLRGKYALSFTVPSLCAEALRSGAADVAIIPAIEYQRIPGLEILPDLSIASKRSVRSLLLIAKRPMAEMRSIALDRSSRSTQALTRILCARWWKVAPEFHEAAPNLEEMLERADAALLIGDPALRYATSAAAQENAKRGWRVLDIVEEWRAMTGLPAVLALWAARSEAVTPQLIEDFQASRDLGVRHIGEVCAEAEGELGITAAELEQYLKENIDFSLDAENLAGLRRYFAEAARLGLIAGAKPLEIAGARLVAKG
jgi:chorismate dehydratase